MVPTLNRLMKRQDNPVMIIPEMETLKLSKPEARNFHGRPFGKTESSIKTVTAYPINETAASLAP